MIEQHLPVLPPVTLLFGSLLVAGIGVLNRKLAYPLALLSVLTACAFSLYGLVHVMTHGRISYRLGGWVPPIGIEYVLDPLSAFIIAVIMVVALLVFIHSRTSVEHELSEKAVPFYSLAVLLLTGFTGMVVTGDLFNLYVFLEIASLAAYGLVAVGEKGAPVAAFRYLVLGAIGASFYLFGVGFLYIAGGSLNMADVATILPLLPLDPSIIAGLVLIVLGIGIKMALFPLHGWLPDAYTLAPSTASALLAPIGTKVSAYVMIRVLFFVVGPAIARDQLPLTELIGWLSAAGILFGSVMAIAQKELKRMLAYSSVAQIGYIGLGIGLANPLGFIGAVLHILNHAVMKACLFLVAGNLRMRVGHSEIPLFNDSLRRTMPWSMAAFTVAALSMIGLPPTAGFFSKWYLVLAAIERSEWVFVATILLSSLLNAVYFFRVLEKVYLRSGGESSETQSGEPVETRNDVGGMMLVPTLVLAIGILLLGVFNAVIVDSIIKFAIPGGL